MKNVFLFLLVFLSAVSGMQAGNMDDIRKALEEASLTQVQEKVYVHTDNQCYFVGDTLWYKAYVVRADNLQPTDMSRILYVELLSPDGLLVERQTVVVAANGYTCGQFELKDSLYSGYYELRAYTRWMLNFNMTHHKYSTHDTWLFYNRQMAADYFRVWDGLYSRVLPVYSKPETAGDYDLRRMYQRPKTRIPRPKKDKLTVNFYPEGGHLVQGVENRVAFDVCDQNGQAVETTGMIHLDEQNVVVLKTEHMGRGAFRITPTDKRLKARFTFHGKQYDIDLPKAEQTGVALQADNGQVALRTRQLPQNRKYGLSVLCGGVLKHFAEVALPVNGTTRIELPMDSLPAGVADITVFDSDGRIWADRLLFRPVGDASPVSPVTTIGAVNPTTTYAPYEQITLSLQLPEPGTTFSLSVRDTATDEPTYDNGNILTTLLLSSELRGFIAKPAYYFESNDDKHRRHLDLLMMVQGWRKYKWEELTDTAHQMRYTPEKTMTVEGAVYKTLNINEVEPEEISSWQDGVGMVGRNNGISNSYVDPWAEETTESGESFSLATESSREIVGVFGNADAIDYSDAIEYGDIGSANVNVGVNHSGLKHEVLVEAEVSVGSQVAGSVQQTKNGRFLFEIPPFYGEGYLRMKAYKQNDSIKKNMASHKDVKALDEDALPDFYVKRDLFYPVYTTDYSYYQRHQPDYDAEMLIDTLSELSMENDVHQLRNINVKGKRRGRRAIDWKKPAYVLDAYELYNDVTDRGLSFGKLDMRQFPVQVCRLLFGNMNRFNSFRVDGRIDGATFYRSYSPLSDYAEEVERVGQFRAHRTPQSLYKMLKLKRLQDIRVFSDFEPRTEDSLMVEEQRYSADATVEFVPIPDEGRQITFRDRHILLHGINMPEAFYQPDYSNSQPDQPTDYRRTLYWNPNAVADEEGRFTATFYNNSKDTRIKFSAAGVTNGGTIVYY